MSELAKIEAPHSAVPVLSETAAIISMIERVARDPSVDLDRMERLYQMMERSKAQQAKTEYLSAFADLQKQLPAVERKGTGHNNKKYARFEDVAEAVRQPLTDNGFSISFRIERKADVVNVVGILGHRSGHTEQTELPLPADGSGSKNAVQAWGSAISYAKRYVMLALLGIATRDEDDDGKAAGDPATITEEQAMELRETLEATGSDPAAFCKYFNVATIGELPAKDYERARAALAKKVRR